MIPPYTIRLILALGLVTCSATAETENFPFVEGLMDNNGKPQPWTLEQVRLNRDDVIGDLTGKTSTMEKDSAANPNFIHVSKIEEEKNYETDLDLTDITGLVFFIIQADDHATLTIKEKPTGEEPTGHAFIEQTYQLLGTALWRANRSYKEFPIPIPSGRTYELKLNYRNTANLTKKYNGTIDYDGVNVFLISGGIDLRIAKYGDEPDLAEDQNADGGSTPPPHEMNPGSVVIAPIMGADGKQITPGKRAKLTVSQNGGILKEGTYTLSASANLTKIEIYEAAEGGEPIVLPKEWSASEPENPKTFYVGSEAFKPEDEFQIAKLTLTYKPPIQAGRQTYELKDEVKVTLTAIEVIELFPKVKDDDGNDLAGSEKRNWGMPLTPFVEENPYANKIAHREIKVRIGSAGMANKKVTWTLEALPGAIPSAIRGEWSDSRTHKNCFEKSDAYGVHGYTDAGTGKDTKAVTTVSADGHTAIRVNVPPIGLNQARIKIQIEGINEPFDLIDMEVPAAVVIDPGHGGKDSGAVARSDKNVKEQALALSYGIKLRDELINKFKNEKRNIRVKMTRDIDEFIELEDRAPYAKNYGADIFVSIHFNSAVSSSARGTETFVERTPGNKNQEEDALLAGNLQASTVAAVKSQDASGGHRPTFKENRVLDSSGNPIPGVKRAGFLVTKDGLGNNGNIDEFKPVKACLVEVEFLSNTNATNSVRIPGTKGEAIRDAFSKYAASDILNHILNQP